MRRLILASVITLISYVLPAQNPPRARDFLENCDSLESRLNKYMRAESEVELRKILCKNDVLDFYFTDDLSFYPWRAGDVEWFRNQLAEELKSKTSKYRLGRIFSKDEELYKWVLPTISYDGSPTPNKYQDIDLNEDVKVCFVNRKDSPVYKSGLSGRHIALWQSHGREYSEKDSLWHWQRAMLHRTVEDLFTQSFVLPFLIPMLENAGAYVMTPRERDTETCEIICDADRHFTSSGGERCRTHGEYSEKGIWRDGSPGFADTKSLYSLGDNPFKYGKFREAECREKADAAAIWTPAIPHTGRYAVYVSYASLPQSTESARYTVHHIGGETCIYVNQCIGGNIWVYLGSFFFAEGKKGCVTLDNSGTEGRIVTADAVKFGGGYGKVERNGCNSGLPAYQEGALYSMPWFGTDSAVYSEKQDDHSNDFFSRGGWVNWMMEKEHVPFDLSLAFHSDAGFRQNDSIVGTLAIHCLYSDDKREYKDGSDRMKGRLLADFVQTQVVNDIRMQFDPEWNRRGLWNKKYAECRIPEVPSMLLELLSHQNLTDMEYGHDPAFKFTACRAVYKGILKFLSSIHGRPYTVQPLPINSFAANLKGDRAELSWRPTLDTIEPTAVSRRYVVYTRIDDGAFNDGYIVDDTCYTRKLKPGHIYSFRVEACNDGGRSFPSEILSVGLPETYGADKPVLIVNNFHRVAAPASIDGPEYGGFFASAESGIPYVTDISYIGENYEFRKGAEWISDHEPGFGATHPGYGSLTVAGNTFDFPYEHGKDLMKLGLAFCSMSAEAFSTCLPDAEKYRGMDIICGKQLSTKTGNGRMHARFPVFTQELKSALAKWTEQGGCILISGCNIASDASADKKFTSKVLGYSMASSNASGSGEMKVVRNSGMSGDFRFYAFPNPVRYCIEAPDGLYPSTKYSKKVLEYPDTNIPAAILFNNGKYKILSIGVPLECIMSQSQRTELMRRIF